MDENKPQKVSLRRAINSMCKNCIYDPIGGPGTWRQQVKACTSKTCPLYPCRPHPIKTTSERRLVNLGGELKRNDQIGGIQWKR